MQRDVLEPRSVRRQGQLERLQAHCGEDHAHDAGKQRQHPALGEQLPHQPRGIGPSALRSAISRWREAARASMRLATLAQAISSTSPTAPSNSSSLGRVSPTTAWSMGTAVTSAAQPSGIIHGKRVSIWA